MVKKKDNLKVKKSSCLSEKECRTEDVLTRLYSYLYVLAVLIDDDKHPDIIKWDHMVIIVDNMFEEIQKLEKYYVTIKYFNEIEQDYYDSKKLPSSPLTNPEQS